MTQAWAGGASFESPSGGGSPQLSDAISDSPGLSYDPSLSTLDSAPTRTVSPVERQVSTTAGNANSNTGSDQASARIGVARGTVRPFGWMLKTIRRTAPGDVVRVKLRQRPHGLWVYDVTVLGKDGRYTQLSLNAADGAVLKRTRR